MLVTSEYSVIQTKEPLDPMKSAGIVEFIEKPDQPQTLDSDIMAVGRSSSFLQILANNERTSAWGAYSPYDAIAELAKNNPMPC